MHPTDSQNKKPQARSIVAFSALIMVLFCVVVAYQASQSYHATVQKAEETSEQLVQSLSSHVELAFLSVDVTLRRAIERHYFNDLFGRTLNQDLENNFHQWVKETPQISGLYLTDAGGQVVIAAENDKNHKQGTIFAPASYVSGYAFFQQAEQGNDIETHVTLYSPPDKTAAAPYIVVSRSYERINGAFGGIMFAVIDPEYFLTFFRSIRPDDGSFMALLHDNGQLLLMPHQHEQEEITVADAIFAQERRAPITRNSNKTQQLMVEGNLKISAYHRLGFLPVLVVTAMDESDFLAGWRSDRRRDIGFLAMFAVFGSILSYFALTMVKQIKRVEESESAAVLASQAKSDFLANMSHELRTPLNAIIGFSEMLDAGYFGKLAPKQKERIHDINLCGNHLLQLINDILEFSKCEAGKMELYEEDTDLSQIIQESVRLTSPRARTKAVEMTISLAPDLPHLHADKRKLRQLLLNLLSNAIKFTEEGGSITVSATLTEGGALSLVIQDTGIGMHESDIPVAMSVFGQVHRASHPEGTGLGLPLCRMFTEMHGGVLEIKSKVGVGTTVTITLPAERVRVRAVPRMSATG